ncbi:hypothetical protein [Streptomyces sp. NPDC000880]
MSTPPRTVTTVEVGYSPAYTTVSGYPPAADADPWLEVQLFRRHGRLAVSSGVSGAF